MAYDFVTGSAIREIQQKASALQKTGAKKTADSAVNGQEQTVLNLSRYVKAFDACDYSYEATIQNRIYGLMFRSYDSEADFWESLDVVTPHPESWKTILSQGYLSREAALLWLQATVKRQKQSPMTN